MQIGMARGVADGIRTSILAGGMVPGEKLPTESTLMQRYGVSRSTVREAVKILQAENIVEIRRGLGSFVAGNTGIGSDPLGLRFAEQSHLLEELMEVRLLLEPRIAECAARRRTEEDLSLIGEALSSMEQAAGTGEDYDAFDYRFHTAVAAAAHNSVLERLFPVIFEAIEKGYEQTSGLHGSAERAMSFHRRILAAIRDENAPEAGRLSRLHIEQTLRDIAERKKGATS